MPLQVCEDGSEVKVLWVVGGLSTRVTDVPLLKQKGRGEKKEGDDNIVAYNLHVHCPFTLAADN